MQAPLEDHRVSGGMSAQNQSVGELCIVIRQLFFEPAPFRLGVLSEQLHKPESELIASLIDKAVSAQAPQVFMDTDQAEGPRAWRCKLRQGGQRLREKLPGHHLEASQRRTSHRDAQGPQRPALAVLRTLLRQP